MTVQDEIVCIIPARSGSKGIPQKNIKSFHGHPLLAWSIAAARSTGCITRIIVSTDNDVYADVARRYGAEVPFLRPRHFSNDDSRDIDYLRHASFWFEQNEGYVPNYFVLLRPTTPARTPEVIESAIKTFQTNPESSSLRSMQISSTLPEKCYRLDEGGKPRPILSGHFMGIPRQNFKEAYIFNGYIDILRPPIFMESEDPYGLDIKSFITESTFDIDTLAEWEFQEYLIKKSPSPLLRYLHD